MPLKLRSVLFSAIEAVPKTPRWAYSFSERSKALGNYIYRNFSAPDLDQINPSRVTVWLHHSLREQAYECNGLLMAEIPEHPDAARLSTAKDFKPDEFYPMLVELLDKSLIKIEERFTIPRSRVLVTAQDFIDGGYRNNWTMASRSPRGLGLEGKLEAELTHDYSELTFVLLTGQTEIHREQVYRSKPDELHWYRNGFQKLYFDDRKFWIASTTGWSYKI
ncbi:MAG: hypothetical protein AAGA08_01720 [Pseudomonadota bacterium]